MYIQINEKAPATEQIRQLKNQLEIALDDVGSTAGGAMTFLALLKGDPGNDGLTVSVNNIVQVDGNIPLDLNDIPETDTNKKMTADERTKLNNLPLATDLTNSLGGKVDKIAGKGLSENDFTDALETKLNGIEAGANLYVHPTNHPPSIITQDASNRFVTDTEKNTWNGKQDAIGFTPENIANKKTTLADNSDTFYPSQKAVKNAVDLKTDKLMATNLVTNGDFSNGTTGWSTSANATVTNVTNYGHVVLAATDMALGIYQSGATVSGRKYYARLYIRATDNTVIAIGESANQTTYNLTPNTWAYISNVFTSASTLFRIYKRATTIGDYFDVDNVTLIDLTTLFGAGNEPTANQMDLLMANFPNSWFNGTVELANVQQMLNYINDLENELHEKTSYGVITGLVTAQQTVADMTVKVSAGTIYMANGDRFTPSATASLTVTTADATNPRIDIIYVSSTGVVSYLAGTAGASPSQPSTPTGGQLLATILVTAGKTSILTADINLRKVSMWSEDWIYPTLLNSYTAFAGHPIGYKRYNDGLILLRGRATSGASGSAITAVLSAYKPITDKTLITTNQAGTLVNILVSSINGNITPYGTIGTYVTLDGLCFHAGV